VGDELPALHAGRDARPVIVTVDTNILVYATAPQAGAQQTRAQHILARGMRTGNSVLLLQALAEFSHVALRKAGIPPRRVQAIVDAWRVALPVHAVIDEDLPAALDAVRVHKLAFWDAMLWATGRRIGVRYLLSEDFQDGRTLEGVRFVNPFNAANDPLIDSILPA